jgi:hypothetical protein
MYGTVLYWSWRVRGELNYHSVRCALDTIVWYVCPYSNLVPVCWTERTDGYAHNIAFRPTFFLLSRHHTSVHLHSWHTTVALTTRRVVGLQSNYPGTTTDFKKKLSKNQVYNLHTWYNSKHLSKNNRQWHSFFINSTLTMDVTHSGTAGSFYIVLFFHRSYLIAVWFVAVMCVVFAFVGYKRFLSTFVGGV